MSLKPLSVTISHAMSARRLALVMAAGVMLAVLHDGRVASAGCGDYVVAGSNIDHSMSIAEAADPRDVLPASRLYTARPMQRDSQCPQCSSRPDSQPLSPPAPVESGKSQEFWAALSVAEIDSIGTSSWMFADGPLQSLRGYHDRLERPPRNIG